MRSRAFCFTWNNYPDDYLTVLLGLGARYFCYGLEIAPTTGTPHLQGYVYFPNPRVEECVRRSLPGVHISVANGTPAQNIKYCSKGGDFHEDGIRPLTPTQNGEAEMERWALAWQSSKAGLVEDIPADIRMRCYSTIRRISQDYMPRVNHLESVCGTWIFGESGCGKTRAVFDAYPDLYSKPRTRWWDGYQDEPVVLLDDVDIYDVKLGGCLKHWADYPAFIAERKGGASRIRPAKLIVTSQYRIEDIWVDNETRVALGRRFRVIEKIRDQAIIL